MQRYQPVLLLLLLCAVAVPVTAGLSPDDVLVVYNSSVPGPGHETDYDWSISKRVADYYCALRGIPLGNQVGVRWPTRPTQQRTDSIPKNRWKSSWWGKQESRPLRIGFYMGAGVGFEPTTFGL